MAARALHMTQGQMQDKGVRSETCPITYGPFASKDPTAVWKGKHTCEILQVVWSNEPLEPNMYSAALCSLVRDLYVISVHAGARVNRCARLATTVLLLFFTLGLQILVMLEVQRFFIAQSVHDVRVLYDKYQRVMYPGRTWLVPGAHTPPEARGQGGRDGEFFDSSLFSTLSPEDQDKICALPFSQPLFLSLVLAVWAFTCGGSIRKACRLLECSVIFAERCSSFKGCFGHHHGVSGEQTVVTVIIAMPLMGKLLLSCLVFIPGILVDCYLLWVGCRLLLATTNFSDLIQNTLALEFILGLKGLLYFTLVPRRTMIEVEHTQLLPPLGHEPERTRTVLGGGIWLLAIVAYLFAYVGTPYNPGFQEVLRHYQWDVHNVCADWVSKRYSV